MQLSWRNLKTFSNNIGFFSLIWISKRCGCFSKCFTISINWCQLILKTNYKHIFVCFVLTFLWFDISGIRSDFYLSKFYGKHTRIRQQISFIVYRIPIVRFGLATMNLLQLTHMEIIIRTMNSLQYENLIIKL